MSGDQVEVYLELDGESIAAGTLGASYAGGRRLGASWFRYRQSYLEHPLAYALDPALPLQEARIFSGEDVRLFNVFEDTEPDDWGKRVIDAKSSRSDPELQLGEFDYLTIAADQTRMGAIRLRVGDSWVGTSIVSELGDVEELAAAAARFEAHEETEEDLRLLGADGTSPGGARPKVSMSENGRLVIVKLPSDRDRGRDGEAWEHLALTLAHRAGITVSHNRLIAVQGSKSSLVLPRFDRDEHGGRIGYMSARTAMQLGEHGHGEVSYLDLADTVDGITGGDRGQLRELFKRAALTVLVNNIDDHWKNHGFLRRGSRWELSPCFDINPSPSRGAVASRALTPTDDPRNRDIRNLIASRDVYALTAAEMVAALSEVLMAVRSWPEVARDIGIPDGEIRFMSGAFSEQQQRFCEDAIGG